MTIFVAEFTTNHMGNLNILLRMVEEAKRAGASIIKMQKKNVETFYSQEKLNSSYPSPYGKTYRDYRSIFEFDLEDFKRFDKKCKELDIPWYTTVQDVDSAHFFANHFDLPMVKIASCNTDNMELFGAISSLFPDTPLVFSIGGTEIEQVDKIVNLFPTRELYIQQCTSTYPCPPEDLRLGNIPALRNRYSDERIHIGYSGHELGYLPSVLAAQMGAEIIERHFCLSRESFVHHIECSLEPDEFRAMVDTVKSLPEMAKASFGIQKSEEKFLIQGAYSGQDFLSEGSHIHHEER